MTNVRSAGMRTTVPVVAGATFALVLAGCSGGPGPAPTTAPSTASVTAAPASEASGAEFPDVIDAELTSNDDGTWQLSVTLSSPYDSPERYANGWRVFGEDGEVLGEHTLTHDHADEQPVTRTQGALSIPDNVDLITIEGSDTANGYGGQTLDVPVSR